MKNYIVLAALPLLFLMACGKKGGEGSKSNKTDSTNTSNIKIDSLAFEVDTFHVIETETKCPKDECTVCDLYYERIKTPLMPVHDSVNRFVDTIVMHALNEMSSASLKYDLKKRALEFIEVSNSPDFIDMGGTWDWSHNTSIYRPVTEIIAVSSSWGGYTGGAHPNYYTETTSFFVSNGKMVRLEDLFTDIDALNKIAVSYFKKDNQLEPDVDCIEQGWDFEDADFKLNNNFDINSESITWQFNSYEIGSYANGAPSVTIPIKDLEKIMKVKFTDVKIL